MIISLKWIEFIKSIESSNIVICANKLDKEDRKIKQSQIEEIANKFKLQYYEISAKNDTNIQKMLYMSVVGLPFFDQYKEEAHNVSEIAVQLEQ